MPRGIPRLPVREKTHPARHKTPILAHFSYAGRTFSRTRRDNMATLKPTTPLLTPNTGPLKPASPPHPKNAPKTPISHPQRRWRFQTGPAGLQGLAAAPVGGGGAWPGDRRAADVTNVVKPTRFKSPREDLCYKRRQSKPQNHHFQRKSRRIDDVCNNHSGLRTKSCSD